MSEDLKIFRGPLGPLFICVLFCDYAASQMPDKQVYGLIILPDHVRLWRNGRRAALRSLWEKSRGSSSLLDRTINWSFLMGLSLAAPQNMGKADLFVDE